MEDVYTINKHVTTILSCVNYFIIELLRTPIVIFVFPSCWIYTLNPLNANIKLD